jgi:WAS family protein 1
MCLDALNYLSTATDEVFGRINGRVAEERGKISDLSSRIATAKAKVDRISGEKQRATTVLSPAKYPAPKVLPNWKPLYHDISSRPFLPSRTKYESSPIETHQGDTREPFLLMQRNIRKQVNTKVEKDGLGRLPENLDSVASLLLFNSNQTPYKAYVTLDNLAGRDVKDKDKEEFKLASAPDSVTLGDGLQQFGMVDFGFNPQLGPVPELNLPTFLPDLPGIADINWSNDQLALPSIAPSQMLAALPSLPTVDILPTMPDASAPASAPPTETAGAPPPPPPPASNTEVLLHHR